VHRSGAAHAVLYRGVGLASSSPKTAEPAEPLEGQGGEQPAHGAACSGSCEGVVRHGFAKDASLESLRSVKGGARQGSRGDEPLQEPVGDLLATKERHLVELGGDELVGEGLEEHG